MVRGVGLEMGDAVRGVAVVGLGAMGTALTHGLAGLPERDWTLRLCSRRPGAAEELAGELGCTASPVAAVHEADVVFCCGRPDQVCALVGEVAPRLTAAHVLVVVDAAAPLDVLRRVCPAQVARVVPSLAVRHRAGALLVDDTGLDAAARVRLGRVLNGMGEIVRVDAGDVRAATDLASCGPAVLAALLAPWLRVAGGYGLSQERARTLARHALVALSALLDADVYPDAVVDEIAVPGGGTERLVAAVRGTDWAERLRAAVTANQEAVRDGRQRWAAALTAPWPGSQGNSAVPVGEERAAGGRSA